MMSPQPATRSLTNILLPAPPLMVSLPVPPVIVSVLLIDHLSQVLELPKQPVVSLSDWLQENRIGERNPIGFRWRKRWHLRVCFQSPALLLLLLSCRTAGVPRPAGAWCPRNLLRSSCSSYPILCC